MTVFLLISSCRSDAQDVTLKQEPWRDAVSVSYTTMRFLPQEQYIGGEFGYSRMLASWIGLQARAGGFPELQGYQDAVSGADLTYATGSMILGHRFRDIGVYGDAGAGVLRAQVFKGVSGPGNAQVFDNRNYPVVLLGGFVDVALNRRWSLIFHIQDDLTLVGAYSQSSFNGPAQSPSERVNAVQAGAGVAYHFK